MNKSQPILPIRFYDDLYDQQRFSKFCSDCVDCQLKLTYPSNAKPHFQFIRKSKLSLPTKFYLRQVCTDVKNNYYKVIPETSSNFGNANIYGNFPKTGIYQNPDVPHDQVEAQAIDINCGNLVSVNPLLDPCNYVLTESHIDVAIDDNQCYKVKIIVDKFFKSVGSAFVLNIYAGGITGILINSITAPGVYIFDLCGSGYSFFTLSFENKECDDDFSISYLQATVDFVDDTLINDIILDETKLKVIPMSDGTDIIVYCGDFSNNTLSIPNADYYYVVMDGSNYYFSEVFSIVTIKEIESYYKLTWWNSCDISKLNSILYASINCAFRNILYLDAGLFNPEYDTTDEGDENGAGDVHISLQKWRKNLNFEVAKSPEFLTDALSAIFMHDNIYLKKPLNNYQDVLTNEYKIIKIDNNISSVLEDCFQRVNLKMLLEDKFIDTGCCTEALLFDCTPCKYVAGDDCAGFDYYLLLPPSVGVHGLHQCSNDVLISVKPTDIICYNGQLITLSQDEFGNYILGNTYPSITNVTLVFFLFFADIYLVPFSFGVVEYNKNGAGWVTADTIQSNDSTGFVSYVVPLFIFFGPPVTDLKLRVHNISLNCDFGYSNEYDVI